MKQYTYGSLFAGVGGFDLGLDAASWTCKFQVEWDKNCQSVLQRHWPDVPKYLDIRDVSGYEVEPVDMIVFGSPCQDLSVAGKRAGLDGEKSGLFFEAVRIIKEMRDKTNGEYPKIALWENVAGALTSNKGEDFAEVLNQMANIGALAIEWHVLDAQWFGVPQRRRRVFLTSLFCPTAVERSAGEILPVPEDSNGNIKKSRKKRKSSARTSQEGFIDPIWYGKTGYSKYEEGGVTLSSSDHKRPDMNFVMHNKEAEENTFGFSPKNGIDIQVSNTVFPPLRYESGGVSVAQPTQAYVKVVRSGKRDEEGNLPPEVWRDEETSPTLNAFDNSGESRATVLIIDGTRVNDVRIYDDGIVPTLKHRMGTGGGQVPLISEEIAIPIQGTIIGRSDTAGPAGKGFGDINDPSYTLDTVSQHGVCTPDLLLRRLTPVECERLMGFPDDHTKYAFDGKLIADTNRYKMCGNAVASPVAEWVGNKLRRLL
jgi:DNA (cytosine-5)-methyltransferase 1